MPACCPPATPIEHVCFTPAWWLASSRSEIEISMSEITQMAINWQSDAIKMAIRPGGWRGRGAESLRWPSSGNLPSNQDGHQTWWLARSRSGIKWSSSPNMAIRCNQMQSDLVVGEVEERDQVELLPKHGNQMQSDAIRPGGWRGRGEESSGAPPQTAARARGRWRAPIGT